MDGLEGLREKLLDQGEPSSFKGKAASVSPPTPGPVSFSYFYHFFASEFIFRAGAVAQL